MSNRAMHAGRVPLVVLLAAACGSGPTTDAPATSRPSAVPSGGATAPSSLEPSGAPGSTPTASGIGRHWIRADLGDDTALDAAFGPTGWAAVGRTCQPDPSCPGWGAAAWTSPDGITWTPVTVPGGTGVALLEVTWTGDAFFAVGPRFASDQGNDGPIDVVTWSSMDGTEWSEIGSFRVDGCDECRPVAEDLVGNTAALLIGRISTVPDLAGPYRSTDGTTWARIEPSPYRNDRTDYFNVDAVATADEIFLAGACRGCPIEVLRSRAGAKWTSVGSTDRGNFVEVSLAYDGRQFAVAGNGCGGECGTTVWSAIDGQPFEQVAELDVWHAHVVSMGTGFVLAGPSNSGPRVFTSLDGETWEELETDLDRTPCAIGALVGGPAGLLIAGHPECPGIWISR
jgi:hypothetical protein